MIDRKSTSIIGATWRSARGARRGGRRSSRTKRVHRSSPNEKDGGLFFFVRASFVPPESEKAPVGGPVVTTGPVNRPSSSRSCGNDHCPGRSRPAPERARSPTPRRSPRRGGAAVGPPSPPWAPSRRIRRRAPWVVVAGRALETRCTCSATNADRAPAPARRGRVALERPCSTSTALSCDRRLVSAVARSAAAPCLGTHRTRPPCHRVGHRGERRGDDIAPRARATCAVLFLLDAANARRAPSVVPTGG